MKCRTGNTFLITKLAALSFESIWSTYFVLAAFFLVVFLYSVIKCDWAEFIGVYISKFGYIIFKTNWLASNHWLIENKVRFTFCLNLHNFYPLLKPLYHLQIAHQ